MTSESRETTKICRKCNGTGFYCMGTLNGKPFSYTGFTCYSCNGTGYKQIKKHQTNKALATTEQAEEVTPSNKNSEEVTFNPNEKPFPEYHKYGFTAVFKKHTLSKLWQAKEILGKPAFNETWTTERYAEYQEFLKGVGKYREYLQNNF